MYKQVFVEIPAQKFLTQYLGASRGPKLQEDVNLTLEKVP